MVNRDKLILEIKSSLSGNEISVTALKHCFIIPPSLKGLILYVHCSIRLHCCAYEHILLLRKALLSLNELVSYLTAKCGLFDGAS